MNCQPPKVAMSGRYSINQTCIHLGIHRNTLRRYTNEGKIRCGYRVSSKRKFYAGSEIIRFWKGEL